MKVYSKLNLRIQSQLISGYENNKGVCKVLLWFFYAQCLYSTINFAVIEDSKKSFSSNLATT